LFIYICLGIKQYSERLPNK